MPSDVDRLRVVKYADGTQYRVTIVRVKPNLGCNPDISIGGSTTVASGTVALYEPVVKVHPIPPESAFLKLEKFRLTPRKARALRNKEVRAEKRARNEKDAENLRTKAAIRLANPFTKDLINPDLQRVGVLHERLCAERKPTPVIPEDHNLKAPIASLKPQSEGYTQSRNVAVKEGTVHTNIHRPSVLPLPVRKAPEQPATKPVQAEIVAVAARSNEQQPREALPQYVENWLHAASINPSRDHLPPRPKCPNRYCEVCHRKDGKKRAYCHDYQRILGQWEVYMEKQEAALEPYHAAIPKTRACVHLPPYQTKYAGGVLMIRDAKMPAEPSEIKAASDLEYLIFLLSKDFWNKPPTEGILAASCTCDACKKVVTPTWIEGQRGFYTLPAGITPPAQANSSNRPTNRGRNGGRGRK